MTASPRADVPNPRVGHSQVRCHHSQARCHPTTCPTVTCGNLPALPHRLSSGLSHRPDRPGLSSIRDVNPGSHFGGTWRPSLRTLRRFSFTAHRRPAVRERADPDLLVLGWVGRGISRRLVSDDHSRDLFGDRLDLMGGRGQRHFVGKGRAVGADLVGTHLMPDRED